MKIMEKFAAKVKSNWNEPGVKLAFIGDSVTQGCFEIYKTSETGLDTVFDQNNGYHQHLRNMLATLYPNVPVNIINAGVSGGSAPHGLERLERDVLSAKPDLVVVNFGLNDCGGGAEKLDRYKEAMDGIFARLQQEGIEAILLTPNMMCTHVSCMVTDPLFKEVAEKCAKRQNEGILDLYVAAAKEIAAARGAAICDCYAKWKQMDANGVNVTRLLANYINHPTREMNKLFAVSLLETMMK
ncbi:MAG: GDSL family lipase [Clostridia bacterium]|nr:GDSL family lipase [Clostridia bacterium]MBQ8893220.1 GDSL family lipase [Clostridia bacterium]